MKRATLILLLLLTIWSPSLQAAADGIGIACTRILKEYVFPKIFADPSGQWHQVVDTTDPANPKTLTIKVGKRINYGMKGGIYVIEEIKEMPEYKNGRKFVAKVSHQVKGIPRLEFGITMQRILKDEEKVYRATLDSISAMERDPEWASVFQGNSPGPSWKSGTFPIVDIDNHGSSSYGYVLAKPFVSGKNNLFLDAVAAEAKKRMKARIERLTASGESLPPLGPLPLKRMFLRKIFGGPPRENERITLDDIRPEMVQSMREWYRLSQIASKHVVIQPMKGEKRLITDLDINPDNLVWVEDREERKAFHLTRPGFIAVELGEPALTHYIRGDLVNGRKFKQNSGTETEYLETWLEFIRKAAK